MLAYQQTEVLAAGALDTEAEKPAGKSHRQGVFRILEERLGQTELCQQGRRIDTEGPKYARQRQHRAGTHHSRLDHQATNLLDTVGKGFWHLSVTEEMISFRKVSNPWRNTSRTTRRTLVDLHKLEDACACLEGVLRVTRQSGPG
jgi:hypothetical protein